MTRMILFASAGLFAATLLTGSAQAAPDAFADACMAHGRASRQVCDCQARLAKASFNTQERQMVIVAMQGGNDAFRASLAKLTEPRRKTFVDKMQKLKGQTEAQCR